MYVLRKSQDFSLKVVGSTAFVSTCSCQSSQLHCTEYTVEQNGSLPLESTINKCIFVNTFVASVWCM